MTYNNVRLRVIEYPESAMCWDCIADISDLKNKAIKMGLGMDIRTEFEDVAIGIGNLHIKEVLANEHSRRNN